MRRLFVTFSVLLMAGLAYAAGRAPKGVGSDAFAVMATRNGEPAESAKAVRVVYPPTNATVVQQPDPQLASAEIAQLLPNPPVQEPVPAAQPQPGSSGLQPNIDAVLRATARLDLNTAPAAEFDRLPGAGRIGRAIVRHRPYRSVDDLLAKHVVRQRVFDRIKDEVAAR